MSNQTSGQSALPVTPERTASERPSPSLSATYRLQPLCTFFPRMPDAEFDALREDIKANGLRQMIVLHDGMILDGSHRFRACIEVGVEPRFVDFGGTDPVSFVISKNLHTRRMGAGQRAAIVASAHNWANDEWASVNAQRVVALAQASARAQTGA